jgi:hypothetical protein
MSDKLKIAISINQETWNNLDFRVLVKAMIDDVDNTELYVYFDVNTASQGLVDSVNAFIDSSDNIYILAGISGIVTQTITDKVLILLSDDNTLINLNNTDNPISLIQNNITGCQAILVNFLIDVNSLQHIYLKHLTFWTNQIKKYK